jgi:hypothetical protein
VGEEGMKRMLRGVEGLVTDDAPRHLFFPIGATFGEQYGQWPEDNYLHLLKHEESALPYLTNLGESEAEAKATLSRLSMQRRKSSR